MKKDVVKDIFKIPNILSLFRILLIPIFISLLYNPNSGYLPLIIIIISSMTDVLDGYIARKYSLITELGKILDPTADKLTQVAILFALVKLYDVPPIVFIIVLSKEFLMLLGALYIKGIKKENVFSSNYFGKIATVSFYFSIFLILLGIDYAIYLLYVSIIITLIAFISYANQLKHLVKEK